MTAIDTWTTKYARWIVAHPWAVILAAVLAIVPAFLSIERNIVFTTNYRVFFSEDNEQLRAFDAIESIYTRNDNVLFIVTPRAGDVFAPDALRAVQRLTQEAWKLPYAIRVDSITNFQHTESRADGLSVADLLPADAPLDAGRIAHIRAAALAEPALVNRLVSPRGHVTGVNVTVQLPGLGEAGEVPQVVAAARALAARITAEHPDVALRLSGMVMFNNAYAESSQRDMQTLVMASFALMLVALALMLRNLSGTFVTVLVILGSVIVALGVGLALGMPITPPSAVTPNILLTVAIASSVHILVTLLQRMRAGMPKREAVVESLRVNLQPVFLTSLTTALGFLSMNFSDAPPFAHLGNFVAIGVVAAFAASVTLLPALMVVIPFRVRARPQGAADGRAMARLADFVVARRGLLLPGMLAVAAALIAFLPRNELNDVYLYYFDRSVPFRQDTEYLTEHLSGVYLVDYSLDSGAPGGVSSPAYLRDVAAFADWYRRQPETVHVSTITDTVKRLHRNMHADDPAWYRLPGDRALTAQYLLLYEMSLPYGLDLNNQINVDKSASRFTVTLKTISSKELLALEERAQRWLAEHAPHIRHGVGSGNSIMFAHIGQRNIVSMLAGSAVALVVISLILVLAFRSVRIGLLSLMPNLLPAAMGFGLWGWWVGEVGLALSIVAGMTLGVIVDDTIHFLSKYLRARREHALAPPEAVRYTFHNVGAAMITTSVVLAAGFLTLSLSTFRQNADMGLLTAIVIVFALAADLLFLPSLLMKLEERKHARARADMAVSESASA